LKILKTILAGVLTATLAFFVGWFGNDIYSNHKTKPTPTPTPAPIVNPQPNNDSTNQVIVIIGGNGTTGADKSKAVKPKPKPKPTPTPTPIPIPKPEVVIPLNKTMPVKGQITAKFISKKDNADLGTQTQPLTGSATISGDSSNFKISMDFTSQLTFGINIPETPKKLWHVGLYGVAVTDGLGFGAHVQRDFLITTIKDIDLIGFGRMEIDKEPKLLFGVEGDF
jgi:hypothetical protein